MEVPMRVPVVLALALPVLVVTSAAAMYRFGRPVSGEARTFYIAADEVSSAGGDGAEAAYRAAVYQEYTDATFTRLKPRPAGWTHLAFLGPLIRADVGDTVRVVFRNRVSFPANVHPDAVLHRPANGRDALSANVDLGWDGDDGPVPPGGTHVYTWAVPAQAGPGPDDHGSVLWLYHSHTGQAPGADAGLIGPMIVYKRGALH
jgi:FtsP/CotA-like multicopper oxidase with cupredoxin domain